MKSRFFKPFTLLVCTLIFTGSQLFAQQSAHAPDAPKKSTDQQFKNDYDSKMAKFDQHYQQLRQKAASTNDPQMKADLDNMLQKMDGVKSDMQRYEANAGNMTEQQKEQARN